MLHSGTIGFGGGGLLLSGAGGAGKSGSVLAGIAHGLQTVGDDYILLDQSSDPVAFPLYNNMKQDLRGIKKISGLEARLADATLNWQGKFEFQPGALFPGSLIDRMQLRAIIFPTIARQATSSLEAIGRTDAVNILTRSMLNELPTEPTHTVMALAKLINSLPVFRMHLSEDPAEIALSLRHFLERLT
jgi:hypothetical protein